MTATPIVSVVIPSYNAAAYLPFAIDSVFAQTFTDFELIVVDDGSTDDTAQRLDPYRESLTYVYQENQERSAARNTGIRLAQGTYIAFLDADDCWHPQKLEKQVALLQDNLNRGMVYCRLQRISPDGSLLACAEEEAPGSGLAGGDLLPVLIMGNFIGGSSALVRRTVVNDCGLFREDLSYIEDWEFFLRIVSRHLAECIPERLTFYRQYPVHRPARMARYAVQDSAVLMLEHFFSELGSDRCPEHLRAQAIANAWWHGAKIDYAVGLPESGQKRFARSLEVDAGLVGAPASFVSDVVDYALGLYAVVPTPYDEAKGFIDTVFRNLPEAAEGLATWHRTAIARLHAGYVFSSRKQSHDTPIWWHAAAAVRNDASWTRNKGLLSIGVESLVGRRMAAATRALLRSCSGMKAGPS